MGKNIDDLAEGNEVFFLYAHCSESHTAYHPPLAYLSTFTDEVAVDIQTAVTKPMEMHRSVIPAPRLHTFSNSKFEKTRAIYDSEIAYTGVMLGELFDHLNRSELNNTVVVSISDHGDLFDELGLVGLIHCLHDRLTNVPLKIDGLDGVVHQSDQLVQYTDVMKPLLSVVEINAYQFGGPGLRSETREYVVSQRSPQRDAPDRSHQPMLTTIRNLVSKYQQSTS